MFKILSFLLLVLCMIRPAVARDSREMRRHYTKALRDHLVLVDRAISESQKGRISPEKRLDIQKGYETLAEKLSKTKQNDFQSLFKEIDIAQGNRVPLERLTRRYRSLIVEAFKVITVPTEVPNVQLGLEVYRENCESCHGSQGLGDGKLAQNKRFPMVPPPTNLLELARSETRTAFSYYNLLITGIPNSIMPTFGVSLSDHERWSLAFFLMADAFEGKGELWDPQKIWSSLSPAEQSDLRKIGGSLTELAQKSDSDLSAELAAHLPGESSERQAKLIIALRRGLAYLSDTPRSRSPL